MFLLDLHLSRKSSHEPPVAEGYQKCGSSGLRCVVQVEYTEKSM